MDEELKKSMDDFFDVGMFAELIGVTVEELIEAFEDKVLEAQEDLEELMQIKHV